MATKESKDKNLKADTDEISTAASQDLYSFFIGDVVPNPDQVVQKESGGLGLKLYEEMEAKDGHIRTVMGTRKLSVVGKEWIVEPASDDKEDVRRADFVQQVFKNIKFDKARMAQLDALMKGFAVSEIIWDISEGDVVIQDFKHRKPWRFVWTLSGELRMLTQAHAIEGKEVPREKFWVFIYDQRYESRYGRPLGESLFWPYWFKKSDIKWWLIFNEKFGSPTAVGKYPTNTSKVKQAELLDAAKALQQESAVTIPEGMVIELLEASRRGSMDTYKAFIDWAENLQSKIVLGQTLTTQQGDGGAYALGQVHDQVRTELVKADCDGLCESLNEDVVRQLVDFNFPPSKNGYPKLWIRTEAEKDLKDLAERDKLITEMQGRSLKKEYVEETYSVELEDQPVASSAATFAESPVPGESLDEDDIPNDLVARLLKEATDDKLIEPIEKLLDQSQSLEAFQDGLFDLVPDKKNKENDKDLVEFGNSIHLGLLAAELAGRFSLLPPEGSEFADPVKFSKLPFLEAIEFLKQKINLPTETYQDIWKEMHVRSFVIAGAKKEELLKGIRGEIEKALTEGTTISTFKSNFVSIIQKHGWSFKQSIGWRSKVLYNTNLRVAYSAGSWKQSQATIKSRPYLRYIGGLSSEPREEHLNWSGTILPADHPWWKTHYPPNGWGCKCKVVSVSDRELKRDGRKVSKSPKVVTRKVLNPVTGKKENVPIGIDPGWDYNPGQEAWKDDG